MDEDVQASGQILASNIERKNIRIKSNYISHHWVSSPYSFASIYITYKYSYTVRLFLIVRKQLKIAANGTHQTQGNKEMRETIGLEMDNAQCAGENRWESKTI